MRSHQDTMTLIDWYLEYWKALALMRGMSQSVVEYTAYTLKMHILNFILESVN